ncbi:hypothetical protein AB833_18090 [Chromatiales bacterium (ex Bugula neritina AB1)]|nr:hypothetical protein AB833_18090 [Chromatiales bacterium (ex Bugula neritina AB1)]
MTSRFPTQLSLAVLTIFILACATTGKTETGPCTGQTIEGPWFRFLLPKGMTVDNLSNGRVTTPSVWLKTGEAGASTAFYLFSPRHGGKAYPIFLDANEVRKLVEFDTENGETVKYIITYENGTVGLYEGNSQRVTGLRVGDTPLGQAEHEKYNCFLNSIEQFSE